MQFFKKGEESSVLTTENNVLDLKVDNSGNVKFEKTESGLKGQVTLPNEFDPSALQQRITELETYKAQAEAKIQALENRQDIKLANAVREGTNLKLTLSDQTEVIVDLAHFLQVIPTSEEIWTGLKAVPTFKADLLAVLKGEVVQDLAGATHGYLLPES